MTKLNGTLTDTEKILKKLDSIESLLRERNEILKNEIKLITSRDSAVTIELPISPSEVYANHTASKLMQNINRFAEPSVCPAGHGWGEFDQYPECEYCSVHHYCRR